MTLDPNYSQADVKRFFAKVAPEPNTGCWLWDGAWHPIGHGEFRYKARPIGAHRFSYLVSKGEVPDGLELDHLCRVPCCVNPNHLEPVTHAENVRRGHAGLKTGALNRSKTHCRHGHPYSGDNLILQDNGYRVYRQCRECRRQINRRSWLKKKRNASGALQ